MYSNAVGGREGGEGRKEIQRYHADKFSKMSTKYLLISLAKIAYKRMSMTIYQALLLILISTSMALL
jgi:hypothetical protein